jgi:cellulose biosynthesis protein BcsQ
MTQFKILVTSQKGGVGKSTVSANLAAFLSQNNLQTALLDFDLHGSSSKWLNNAPDCGVNVVHYPLPLEIGGNQPVQAAKSKLSRLSYNSDIIVADLTWSDSITAELLFEFDLVIVPTSVSEIELNATSEFLSRFRWVFESEVHPPPKLLLCPTRVQRSQVADTTLFRQHFPVRLMLSPAVLEGASAQSMYKRGFVFETRDECGRSFNDFGRAVVSLIDTVNQQKPKPAQSESHARLKALLRMAAQYDASFLSPISTTNSHPMTN